MSSIPPLFPFRAPPRLTGRLPQTRSGPLPAAPPSLLPKAHSPAARPGHFPLWGKCVGTECPRLSEGKRRGGPRCQYTFPGEGTYKAPYKAIQLTGLYYGQIWPASRVKGAASRRQHHPTRGGRWHRDKCRRQKQFPSKRPGVHPCRGATVMLGAGIGRPIPRRLLR